MKQARFVEVESERCPWCEHVRCQKCDSDRWANLADGCCICRSRVLQRLVIK
jgi:hypothetical protein